MFTLKQKLGQRPYGFYLQWLHPLVKNIHPGFTMNWIWIFLPIDLCDIVYFHPSQIPLESVDERRAKQRPLVYVKALAFSEGHQS